MTVDYQILLTPLDETGREYGTRVDVTQDIDISDFVKKGGIGTINAELDQGEYDIGVFNYNNIKLSVNNASGKFNEKRMDSRSIFPSIRDRALVQVLFIDPDSTETISFEGLITDKATRQNVSLDSVDFTFLDLSSILDQVNVSSGTIIDGMTFSTAFRAILDVPAITDILTFTAGNINPEIDLAIDVGSKFNNLTAKKAVDKLLLAANSILIIDSNRNIIVKSRAANSNTPHSLYLNDVQQRDNILNLTGYNNGLQRMFNVVVIDSESFDNKTSTSTYNDRTKYLSTVDFITTSAKKKIIADAILAEFALPRDEMIVTVEKKIATDFAILDKTTVSFEQLLKPADGQFAPLYEIDSYDRSYYPNQTGGFRIDGRRIFKIIGIFEQPSTFNVGLKLRDTGELTT